MRRKREDEGKEEGKEGRCGLAGGGLGLWWWMAVVVGEEEEEEEAAVCSDFPSDSGLFDPDAPTSVEFPCLLFHKHLVGGDSLPATLVPHYSLNDFDGFEGHPAQLQQTTTTRFSLPKPVNQVVGTFSSPLSRVLSILIHKEARKFVYQTGVKVVVAYGGAPINQQLRELERGVDILVATPGRRIVEQMDMPRPGLRQTMLFSVTFTKEIQQLASDFLANYVYLAVGHVGSSTDLIAPRVEFVLEPGYIKGYSRGAYLEAHILNHHEVLLSLTWKWQQAQDHLTTFTYKVNTDVIFQVGNCIYLELQFSYKHSVPLQYHNNLRSRFFDLSPKLQYVGEIAYNLKLIGVAHIHSMFIGTFSLPLEASPSATMEQHGQRRHNLLTLNLEDKVHFRDGSNVMNTGFDIKRANGLADYEAQTEEETIEASHSKAQAAAAQDYIVE
ncbi:hypothetical protein Tsubulata_029529 [Turnera subulata]|uniref:Helicase ATP-binding domain-containing protein n=1 Tax=Turnera subulata TaxID=218843 RepID=A0A9Q0GG72_9ROSI|nr:hypothetical protein Tsubulata_029529 [Turnera subulata]